MYVQLLLAFYGERHDYSITQITERETPMKKINISLAIVAVAGLTAFAISKGINGALLMSALTILGGLGGFAIAKKTK